MRTQLPFISLLGLFACGAEPVEHQELLHSLTTPVPHLDGLGGTYQRMGFVPYGELNRLSLTPGLTSDAGTHQRTLNRFCWPAPACTRVSGPYTAIPENPAIGFAALRLGPEPFETYRIDGLLRDPGGRVTQIQLSRLNGNLWGPPFMLRRSF